MVGTGGGLEGEMQWGYGIARGRHSVEHGKLQERGGYLGRKESSAKIVYQPRARGGFHEGSLAGLLVTLLQNQCPVLWFLCNLLIGHGGDWRGIWGMLPACVPQAPQGKSQPG